MRKSKLWKRLKVSFLLVYGLGSLLLVGVLAWFMLLVLGDKQSVTDNYVMNSIALVLGLVSLPGVIISLFSLLDHNSKRKFKATTVCPKCRQLIELKLTEE